MPKSVMFVIFLLAASFGASLLLVTGEAAPNADTSSERGDQFATEIEGLMPALEAEDGTAAERVTAALAILTRTIAVKMDAAGSAGVQDAPAEGSGEKPDDLQFVIAGKAYCFPAGDHPLWDQGQALNTAPESDAEKQAITDFLSGVKNEAS